MVLGSASISAVLHHGDPLKARDTDRASSPEWAHEIAAIGDDGSTIKGGSNEAAMLSRFVRCENPQYLTDRRRRAFIKRPRPRNAFQNMPGSEMIPPYTVPDARADSRERPAPFSPDGRTPRLDDLPRYPRRPLNVDGIRVRAAREADGRPTSAVKDVTGRRDGHPIFSPASDPPEPMCDEINPVFGNNPNLIEDLT